MDDLLALRPLADRNIVYNFHLYDPHTFTHQGANWGDAAWQHIKGLPYPSSPESVAPALAGMTDAKARQYVEAYGRERWDVAKLEAKVQRAARWAEQHGAPLTCNEFGTYRTYSPRESRLAWIKDVRSTLDKYGIAWAMWDYAGGFGVVTGSESGKRAADLETAVALGLG